MPTISGTAQEGQVLTASPGTWSGDAPISFSYLWSNGQTGSTDTLSAADVGQSITVTVTASNAGGQMPAGSAPVGPALPAAPQDTVAPGITGTAQQGHKLTVSDGVWTNNPTSYSYAWQECNKSGDTCTPISGATSNTYTLKASDVGRYVSATVTATNAGGQGTVTSASVGPVLPPAPVNIQAPAITGTAEQGDTLTVSTGTWSNGPTEYRYVWETCDGSGGNCSAIKGATSSSYALSAADVGHTITCVVTAKGTGGSASVSANTTAVVVASPIPVASQPTTTELLATPSAPVTNQSVTLIATVTVGTSSTALWGNVTFQNGGAPIGGCTNIPATPSGLSATVACTTSFAASRAQVSATFTPTTGSILKGSASPVGALTVGPDSSSTSLDASTSVTVGANTTYTATVTPPASRPGPVEPTGSVEFLDGGQPIASCASQPLTNGGATCTVSYSGAGAHQITARYAGDANFIGSSSPTGPVSVTPVPTVPASVVGTITSTMQWAFYYTPKYTVVRRLVVNGASPGVTVTVRCIGHGCPFVNRAIFLAKQTKCGQKAKMCFTAGSFNLTLAFAGHRLAVGTRFSVRMVRPNWIGKSYMFTVRPRRGPRIQIGCLAPGGTSRGLGC